MERVISPEERMKRAEEIYYRRKAQGVRVTTTSVNIGKENKISLGKKMIIQIIVCIIIYLGFWLIKGYNNVFGENVINQTKAVLNYDINFVNLYNQCKEYFDKNFNSIIKNSDNKDDENMQGTNQDEKNIDGEDKKQGEEQSQESSQNSKETEQQEQTQQSGQTEQTENSENNLKNEGIGGGSDTQPSYEHDGTQKAKLDSENKTQMEQDAEFVKQKYNIVKPIEGRITSPFGDREATEIISAFHQGVDIGATTGTVIHAAMEGTVVAASYAGDYGNHIKIQNGEILTVYAHCSELNVNVGDYITQGQEIGKVGATGKVTGPHLHFEIRRDGRYVNPELILNF